MPKVKVAVDFDRTITTDVDGWVGVMSTLRDRGFDVFVVTARSSQLDRCGELDWIEYQCDFPVFYTNGVAKKFWCLHNGPGEVDIWIDDKPENILENSTATPEFLVEWRATREF
jgi:5'(3')-deoxyribonucleotidase